MRHVGNCCRDCSIRCACQMAGGVLHLIHKVTADPHHVQRLVHTLPCKLTYKNIRTSPLVGHISVCSSCGAWSALHTCSAG